MLTRAVPGRIGRKPLYAIVAIVLVGGAFWGADRLYPLFDKHPPNPPASERLEQLNDPGSRVKGTLRSSSPTARQASGKNPDSHGKAWEQRGRAPAANSVQDKPPGESITSRSAEGSGPNGLDRLSPMTADKTLSESESTSEYFRLGRTAQKAGDYNRAEEYYVRGLAHAPQDLAVMLGLSEVYIQQGKYEQAVVLLEYARRLYPDNPDLLINFGMVELKREHYPQARHWLEDAWQIDRRSIPVLKNLAYLAQLENNLADQEKYYRLILEISPDHPDALLGYASVLEKTGRLSEAVEKYRQCLDAEPVRNDPDLMDRIKASIQRLGP